jgi:hypothetical protein
MRIYFEKETLRLTAEKIVPSAVKWIIMVSREHKSHLRNLGEYQPNNKLNSD